MKTHELEHLGLGALTSMVGLSKASAMEALKLGAGSALGITATDLLLSKVLVGKDGAPMVPVNWSPAAIALMGLVLGGVIKKKVSNMLGVGVVAGTVGLAISTMVKRFTAPAASASTAAANSAEMSGYGPQAVAGFGDGRAFAGGLGSFAGLMGAGNSSAMYGVGTPDMSAGRMFNGATVAIEDGGPMAGATVQYEDAGNFAGALN